MNKRIWILVFLLAGLLLAGGLYFSLSGGEDEEEPDEGYRTLTIKLQGYTVSREFTAKRKSSLRSADELPKSVSRKGLM